MAASIVGAIIGHRMGFAQKLGLLLSPFFVMMVAIITMHAA